jgi:hypothetical protein
VAEPIARICVQVDDSLLPDGGVPTSTQQPCVNCGKLCWVDSVNHPSLPGEQIWCLRCATQLDGAAEAMETAMAAVGMGGDLHALADAEYARAVARVEAGGSAGDFTSGKVDGMNSEP